MTISKVQYRLWKTLEDFISLWKTSERTDSEDKSTTNSAIEPLKQRTNGKMCYTAKKINLKCLVKGCETRPIFL